VATVVSSGAAGGGGAGGYRTGTGFAVTAGTTYTDHSRCWWNGGLALSTGGITVVSHLSQVRWYLKIQQVLATNTLKAYGGGGGGGHSRWRLYSANW
jgi:hypothetical protein